LNGALVCVSGKVLVDVHSTYSSRTARVGCHKNKTKQMHGVLSITVFFFFFSCWMCLHTHSLGVWAEKQNLLVFLFSPFFAFSKGTENI